ncbi:MAG: alpha/beta hydrolase [Thermoleophilaceae bacterium]
MKHVPPAPPALGERDGLAYALFKPEGRPAGGVVILHGAGSSKESHFDFARTCRERGLAALAFDARGHGRSSGELGPTATGDVLAMCDFLGEHAPQVAVRGSSLGGFLAIQAAALDPAAIAAVVAICPAPAEGLARGIASGELTGFRVDRAAAVGWLKTLDLRAAVARLGPATALLLLHARGDERVPYTVSEELHEAAAEPKRLVVFPGGHHRSLQHDLEVQNLAARFIERAFAARTGP